jgi:hypothetical protein
MLIAGHNDYGGNKFEAPYLIYAHIGEKDKRTLEIQVGSHPLPTHHPSSPYRQHR